MKLNTLLLAALLLPVAVLSSDKKQRINTSIDRVTVFRQNAQVFRKANITVQPGVTEVVFVGLSPNINEQTMRVSGKGEFVILEVKRFQEFPEPKASGTMPNEVMRKIRATKDSLSDIDLELRVLKAEMDELIAEANMMRGNKLAKGEGKSDSLGMFINFMSYFRKQMSDIDRNYIRAERQHAQTTERRREMDERYRALQNYKSNTPDPDAKGPDHQVIVTISADKAGQGRLELSYMVTGAGWTPLYDLRANDSNSPLSIMYKAQVHQQTGEEWKDVRLTLSTSDPQRNNTRPNLQPWNLSYQQPQPRTQNNYSSIAGMAMTRSDDAEYKSMEMQQEQEDLPDAILSSELVTTNAKFATVEFDVPLPYTIASNGEKRTIALRTEVLPTDYFHYLVPKLDRESYIVARTSGWEKLDLLPGTANIYYDGTYVGQTQIDPDHYSDTVEFALGRDPRVTGTWERLKDEVKGKPLGHDRVITRGQRMAINNRTGHAIKLLVDDQIPVSHLDQILVALTRADGGKLNTSTGVVRWELDLSKGEKELRPEFTVTLPKDMPLSGL